MAIDHMRDMSDLTKRVAPDASAEDRLRHYVRTYLRRSRPERRAGVLDPPDHAARDDQPDSCRATDL